MKHARVCGLTLIALVASGRSASLLPDDPERILDLYIDAYNHGDADALASLYGEDARILPQGRPMIHGQRNIEAFWKRRLSLEAPGRGRGSRVVAQILDKGAGPDIGYVVASMAAPVGEAYNFTLCLKRNLHGEWRIAAEMWNEGSPRFHLVPAQK